jgi:hypothetical protein
VLERVPAEHLSWKPHEKSSSLGKLAWHIASLRRLPAACWRPDGSTSRRRVRRMPENAGEILGEFQRNHAETRGIS